MAIDLQNPTNIGTGWGRPPDFSAPNIGSMVGDILKTRLLREEQQQKQIADAIKQYQSQRSDAAYIQAAQNAGVLPQGDYSGMSAKEASDLAQRIQDITPDTDADRLKQAMANYYDRLGGRGGGGGGGGGSAEPQTYWDEQGREWRPGPGGRWIPIKPTNTQTPGTPKLSPTEKGWAAPEIPGVSVDINAPDQPGRPLAPDVPAMPEDQPDAVPQASPAQTPIPPGKGADQNLAPDYGVPAAIAPSRDKAKVGQTYYDPNGNVRVRGD